MEFRFVAYDPKTDQRLYQLPRTNSVQIGDTFGTRGTLELKYSASAIDARDLPTFLKVQAEVTFDEGHTWAEIGPSLLRLSGEHEDTDAAGMRTLRFVGREWILDKARVGTGELELIDGKRPFYQSSPGRIIRTLILEAQDRGAAQGIKLGNFTTDRDAAGNLWPKVATIYYSPGLPIASVLENLVEQGMCDYRMDGDTLNLYAPETAMGRDLTDRANPVRVHGAVTEAPVKYSLEDLASSALLIGDEGFELEVDNPSAPDDYGRLEVTIEQGGVSDPGTARIMVDEALQRGSREIKEITRSQSASGAAFLPYRDYRVGDYVQVLEDGQWQKYRVRELQLTRDGQDWTIHAVINDRLQELLLKLAKRTNGIVNGTKGSGGDGTRPTPPENPGIEPAAPEGLIIDQMVYLDRQGIARGQITAGWGAVTKSTKGQNVEIGGYELWTRRNETHASWVRAASTDGDLTATHSPVVLSDADGNALEYQWRVRAIAQASNRPGPWSDTVTLMMTQDTEPPSVPSLPTVATDLRIITVDWDGLDESAEAMPVDFNHLRVYFAAAEDMAGAERVGSLSQRGTWTSGSMPADVPVWVAVSAVDNVGNESALTPAQSVTPKRLVDDDSIRDELSTIDNKIDDAVADLNQAIDNIVIDANGTTTYQTPYEPDETTDPAPKDGDLWFNTADNMKLSRFDGAVWVSAADQRIDTIRQAQDDLESDVDRVRTSVDGKNAITQSTSTPPNQYSGAVGDIWEIMSSMGSGGRSVSRWRWNGTVWVSNLIGDTVLGNVDAAKIGTGYLDADRIEAGSITADKVLIGSGGNIIPWGQVTAGTTYAPHEPYAPTGSTASLAPADSERGIPAHLAVTRASTGSWASILSLWATPGQKLPVDEGAEYAFSVRVYSSDVSQARLSLFAYTHGGSSTANNSGVFASSTGTSIGNGVVKLEVRGRVPAGAGYCLPYLQSSGAGTVGVIGPDLRKAVGSTLIENGAVTTDKIAVGAITAESGVVRDLDAGTIAVGEMEGARIKAGTVTADKLLVGVPTNLLPGADDWAFSSAGWSGFSRNADLEAIWIKGTQTIRSDEKFTLAPGEYSFTVEARGSVSGTSFYVQLIGEDGNFYALSNQNPGTGWTLFESTFTITATDRFIVNIYGNHVNGVNNDDGYQWFRKMKLRPQVGATLIEDGAITTDKILANAITTNKIAALAIEADHISANAITADKIKAGAIDGKLITGARIRTAASGRRTELDVEGLTSYNSNGKVVLTTDTSDGSIEMLGNLTQTRLGITFEVGRNYEGAGPGIQWSDSNIYAFPPGVVYSKDPDDLSKMRTLIQGPGVTDANSYLTLQERGNHFDLRSWKGLGSAREDWRILGDMANNLMRIGSSTSDAPYMYFRRGTGTTGAAWMGYNHPTNGGYASLALRDRYIWLGAYDANGNVVSRLWGDADSTALTAGGRNLSLFGRDIFVTAERDITFNSGGEYYFPTVTQGSGAPLGRSSGKLVSMGSARKYKLVEEPIEATVESLEDKILSVEPKTWISRDAAEQLADYKTAIANGEEPEKTLESIGTLARDPGVVAEDLEAAGLGIFVGYENGEPEWVKYDRIGPALIPIIRRLRDRVDALEQQLGETA